MVNSASKLVSLEQTATGQLERPATGETALVAPAPPAALPSVRLSADDYVGDVAERTGFGGLEAVDEVTMLCVPDLMSAYQQGAIDLDTVQAVQLSMIAHCELMGDRVAILDPPPGLNAQQIREWRVDKARFDSAYATLYWPWVRTHEPRHRPARARCRRPATSPASGAATTTPAACTRRRPTRSCAARSTSSCNITRNEHDLLNPEGINVHPRLPGPRHPGLGRADAAARTRSGAT